MEQTDLSVVIAVPYMPALLPVSLAHLDSQTFPSARFEIILAAYGRGRDCCEQLEQLAAGSPVRVRCVPVTSSNRSAGLNRAVDAAEGNWLLFLDEDLIAGSHLVERHVAAQERRGGHAAIVGPIERHPQSHEGCYTKWGYLESPAGQAGSRPINALRWRMFNLSLPRSAVLEAGGFDEGFKEGGLIDIDLAWRLSRAGVPGYYQKNATAYALRGVETEAEEHRNYLEGYSLYRLSERTEAEAVKEQFLSAAGPGLSPLGGAAFPVTSRLCRVLGQHTPLFGRLFPHVLRQRRWQGFRDARSGRPPRPYLNTEAPDAPAPSPMQMLH